MSLHDDPDEEGLVKLAEPLPEVNSLPSLGSEKWFTHSSTSPPSGMRGGYSLFLRLLRTRNQTAINTMTRPTPPAALVTTSITMLSGGEPVHVHRESRYVFL